MESTLKYFLPIWQSGDDFISFIKETFLLRLRLVRPVGHLPTGLPKFYRRVQRARVIGPGFSYPAYITSNSISQSQSPQQGKPEKQEDKKKT